MCSWTNSIFEKVFVPEIWAKLFAANQITGFLNQPISRTSHRKSLIFVYVDTNSHKLKVDQKFLVGMIKNGCSQSSHETLKLTVSQEWIDGANWFFGCWCTFRKAKSYFNDFGLGMVKFSSLDLNICCILKMSLWIKLIFFMLTVLP